MRIIGQIEHPQLKISIFKMEERYSVKFENEGYEQTYKLGSDERANSLEKITQLIDPAFIQHVMQQMQSMHQNRMAAFARHTSAENMPMFDEII